MEIRRKLGGRGTRRCKVRIEGRMKAQRDKEKKEGSQKDVRDDGKERHGGGVLQVNFHQNL